MGNANCSRALGGNRGRVGGGIECSSSSVADDGRAAVDGGGGCRIWEESTDSKAAIRFSHSLRGVSCRIRYNSTMVGSVIITVGVRC